MTPEKGFRDWVPEEMGCILQRLYRRLESEAKLSVSLSTEKQIENFNAIVKCDRTQLAGRHGVAYGSFHLDVVDSSGWSHHDVWGARHSFTLWMPIEAPNTFFWLLPAKEKEPLLQRKVSIGDAMLFSQTLTWHAGPVSNKMRLSLCVQSISSMEKTRRRERAIPQSGEKEQSITPRRRRQKLEHEERRREYAPNAWSATAPNLP